jgi:hypothetical protein
MEGGVIRYSGTAAELKDNPELLRSAYLLRGSQAESAEAAAETALEAVADTEAGAAE